MFLPLSSAICQKRVPAEFIGRNDKQAIGFRVANVDRAQISASRSLANRNSRAFASRTILTWIRQNVFDFFLVHSVIVNMRKASSLVEEESNFHLIQNRQVRCCGQALRKFASDLSHRRQTHACADQKTARDAIR